MRGNKNNQLKLGNDLKTLTRAVAAASQARVMKPLWLCHLNIMQYIVYEYKNGTLFTWLHIIYKKKNNSDPLLLKTVHIRRRHHSSFIRIWLRQAWAALQLEKPLLKWDDQHVSFGPSVHVKLLMEKTHRRNTHTLCKNNEMKPWRVFLATRKIFLKTFCIWFEFVGRMWTCRQIFFDRKCHKCKTGERSIAII